MRLVYSVVTALAMSASVAALAQSKHGSKEEQDDAKRHRTMAAAHEAAAKCLVVHLDAGHLSQTMYLSATELGLGAFVTAAINDRVIEAELHLPPLREGAIALVGFGPRAPSMRTLELDVFEPVRPDLAGD